MNRNIYISGDIVSLVEYIPCDDDRALYENWQDPEVQKGFNGVSFNTFEEFQQRDSRRSRFFAMIRLNGTDEIIGSVGISPPETEPDLSIWIYKPYRKQGYGTQAFALAAKYATEVLGIQELYAGAYPDNIGSIKCCKNAVLSLTPPGISLQSTTLPERILFKWIIYTEVN